MFDFDNLREIWSTIKKNKLRTFLTGFSVAWGIFMLISLLGAGNGLANGIAYNFRNMGENTVTCWSRYTTMPYKGLPIDRRIRFNNDDLEAIPRDHPEVGMISGANYKNDTISFDKEYLTGQLVAVHPDWAAITVTDILSGNGRFINEQDMREMRKVIVLSPRMAEVLFRDTVKPLGQFVKVGGLMFQVVGIYKEDNSSNNSPAYIPFSTGQSLWSSGYHVGNIRFTLNGVDTEEQSEAFFERFRQRMAFRHQYDPADLSAIGMWDTGSEFRMWKTMTNGISFFIWIVGIGTLMAGIVGVSNIMLITVRERTREFGIRKAIGAKPSSILKLIIFESILVTAVFGYIGMMLGVGLTELISYVMEMAGAGASHGENIGEDISFFRDPTVNLGISISATVLIVIAGVLAGYFPALKAVRISAIEAMRAE